MQYNSGVADLERWIESWIGDLPDSRCFDQGHDDALTGQW
jgi:hypothetical protein